jgi:sulfur-oxidizing protein SoxX
MRAAVLIVASLTAAALTTSAITHTQEPAPGKIANFTISGDAIKAPLDGLTGDAARGRTLAYDPERGNCTICHPVPGGDTRVQGTVGPPLAGVATRLDEGQLRMRLVDGTKLNPATIMPPYHRIEGLNRVGREFAGKPILDAQQIEDIVAFLATLRQ